MKQTPESIQNYLMNLDGSQCTDGYLRLNENQVILASDGWVGTSNLVNIDRTKDPEQSIPVLEGLLPGNSVAPTVIKHAHVDRDYYFDIHIFHDHMGTWVVFIDKTRSAKLLQKKQQIRLTNDFNNGKQDKAS